MREAKTRKGMQPHRQMDGWMEGKGTTTTTTTTTTLKLKTCHNTRQVQRTGINPYPANVENIVSS